MIASERPTRKRARPDRYDSMPHPSCYRHWTLAVDGRRTATLTLDVDEDAGIRPGLQTQVEFVRPRRRHRVLNDALQRIRFEHPFRRDRRDHERQGSHVLRRREHLHARDVDARVESQLL